MQHESLIRLVYWMAKQSKTNLYNLENRIITQREWFINRKKTNAQLDYLIRGGYLREIEDIKGGPNVYQITQKLNREAARTFGYEKFKFQELEYKVKDRKKKEKAKVNDPRLTEEFKKKNIKEQIEQIVDFDGSKNAELVENVEEAKNSIKSEKDEIMDFFNNIEL